MLAGTGGDAPRSSVPLARSRHRNYPCRTANDDGRTCLRSHHRWMSSSLGLPLMSLDTFASLLRWYHESEPSFPRERSLRAVRRKKEAPLLKKGRAGARPSGSNGQAWKETSRKIR